LTQSGRRATNIDNMNKIQEIPWPRILAEGTAIVISILLAFWIQAWWESRGDARQGQALLAALAEDFAQADELLSVVKSMHVMTSQAGEQLITLAEKGEVPEADRRNVDLLISSHFARYTFDPPMGTVESVLGSGRIDLLTSQELIAELTKWSAVVTQLNNLEIEARDHFYNRIYPYLASRIQLKDLDKGYPQFFDSYPWVQKQTEAYKLVSDQEFISIVYLHWVIKTNILVSLEPVEASLTRIRELINVELSD
jgi:hypothetical protein